MAKYLAHEKYKDLNQIIIKILFMFFSFLGMIPRRYARMLAEVIGRTWFVLDWPHRKVALDNLKIAFGNEKNSVERKHIARAAFINISMIPFEIGWSLGLGIDDIYKHCQIKGLEHVSKAQAKGKGVLLLGLHIGNWELLPVVYISNRFNLSMIYRPLDLIPADSFVLQYRRRFGGNPIPKKKSMRKVISALKEQGCVGILLDQDPRRKYGVFVDFFSKPACTNVGMALLALKTGAPVLPTYIVRDGSRFSVHIGPEIPLVSTGQKEHDIQKNTEAYNKVLEQIIREHPEQWLWMHKRWKTKPILNTTPPR